MNVLKQYAISFSGLKLGIHQFNFEVNDTFFEYFNLENIKHGTVKIEVSLEKQSSILVLNFLLDGKVSVPCARCNENVEHLINGVEKLIVNFGNNSLENTDEIVVLPYNEDKIEIANFIYEFILLHIPIRCVHEQGLCNEEMINTLKKYSSKQTTTDSRWDKLKNLRNN